MSRRCAVEAARSSCPNPAEYLLRARGHAQVGVCEPCLPRAVNQVLKTGRRRSREVTITLIDDGGTREPRTDPAPLPALGRTRP